METDPAAIDGCASDWDRLAAAMPLYIPQLTDTATLRQDPAVALRLVGVRRHGVVACLALFVIGPAPRGYWLGGRRLFSLTLGTARLFGPAALGTATAAEVAAMIDLVGAGGGIDLFSFDDIADAGPLYAAVVDGAIAGPRRVSHFSTARRLIDLPATMADYWASLRASTRRTAQRYLRLYEQVGPAHRLYTGQDAIDLFLPAAAALSARTYQAGMGFGLVDDAATRARFARLAGDGRLLCYLALVAGEPAAFLWGDVSYGTFYFRATGYDPALTKHRVGKGLLFHIIQDLIDRRAAARFDFGIRDMAYKEQFSTRSVDGAHVLLGRGRRPRGLVAITVDRGLDALKATLTRSLSGDRIRQLRRRLRRPGSAA